MLSSESSLMLAATTGAVVYGTYSLMMPSIADTRALPGNTPDIDAAEKNATGVAIAVVSGISLLAKSPEVFVIGGLITIAVAWSYKHASQKDSFQEATRNLITPSSSNTPSGVTLAAKQDSTQLVTSGSGSAF